MLRRLKLGKMLDTLPERRSLAKQNKLAHAAFVELVLADEIDRRDRTSAARRARTAGLDPAMTLEAWQDHDHVIYDHDVLAELTTMRFVEDAQAAFIPARSASGKPTSLMRWVTSPAAAGCGSTPTAPTGCSNGSRAPGWTTATSTSCVG